MKSEKILIDSSVWVEYFNRKKFVDLINSRVKNNDAFSTGIVYIELLQGANSGKEFANIVDFFGASISKNVYTDIGRDFLQQLICNRIKSDLSNLCSVLFDYR